MRWTSLSTRNIIACAIVALWLTTDESKAASPSLSPARFFSIDEVFATHDAALEAAAGNPKQMSAREIETSNRVRSTAAKNETGDLFGMQSFSMPNPDLLEKWREAEKRIANDFQAIEACEQSHQFCTDATKQFLELLANVASGQGRAQIEIANRLVNASIYYTDDAIQHKARDVWSGPLTSLVTGRGDCEDYAIEKYSLLRKAGISNADLLIVLGRELSTGADHAVLAVRYGDGWLILSNNGPTANDREFVDFQPIYTLGPGGISLLAMPYHSPEHLARMRAAPITAIAQPPKAT